MQKWEPSLKGLIWGFYGGQEAGTAISEALFGKVNPSGKLPMTFEKKWEDSPAYNSYHDPDKDKHVAYTEGIFIGVDNTFRAVSRMWETNVRSSIFNVIFFPRNSPIAGE